MVSNPITADTVLLGTLWQTTAWLAAGLALSVILERRPARAHGAVLLCMTAAVLTPVISIACRALGWGMLAPLSAALLGSGELPPDLAPGRGAAAAGLLTWVFAAGSAWLVLSALAVSRLVVSAVRGRRLLASATTISGGPLSDLARAAARELGFRNPPVVLVSPSVSCPAIWCWGRRPRLLLPQHTTADAELFGVLCHELAHCKRRDHLASLGGQLALCLLPWNPLVWLANRRLRDLSEQACDAWALAAGESPTTYAETLLGLIPQRHPSLALAAVNGRRALTRRITRILKPGPGNPRLGAGWVTLSALATVLLVSTAALAHRRAADPQTGPAPDTVVHEPTVETRADGSIYVVPHELDLGWAAPNETRTQRIWLVNGSTQAHRITSAKASCGCTVVNGFEPTTLGPGKSLMLEVSMTAPARVGAKNLKHVTFQIDGQAPLKLPVRLEAVRPAT
ncbi:MAG: M56 family metallopeptidase [Planctomycetota bacterium]|jgi:beta-lactamase regulating signal transducer with metallopeptidase domain